MSDLRPRVLTAVALVPLIIGGILILPTPWVGCMFAAIILLAAWEWSSLMGWSSLTARACYTMAFVPGLYVAYLLSGSPWTLLAILGMGLLWWLSAFIWVIHYESGNDVVWLRSPFVAVFGGWLVLVPPWTALVALHARGELGPSLVLFLLLLIWAADIGAFFVGRRWGVHKLARRVSPGKSWQGVGGGVLAAGPLAVGFCIYGGKEIGAMVPFVLLCLFTVPVSVLGDLAESLIKRQAGVKDSGRLLPGHGGVLDRIDSMTAAAPFFVLGVLLLPP